MPKIQSSSTSVITNFLIVYGLCHALVDASCAFLLLGAVDVRSGLLSYIILYNALAFVLQVPLGWLLDKYEQPKLAAITGVLIVLAAWFFLRTPAFAIVLAGFGNALFHVGGGQIALNIDHQKAKYPGIFVAPGGVGLALGIYLATSPVKMYLFVFPAALLLFALLLLFTKVPAYSVPQNPVKKINYFVLVVVLLLLSIAIRSVVGLTVNFPWKSNVYLLVLLTAVVALGKAFGGILADKFGWMKTGIFGLLLALPLLSFGSSYVVLGVIGALVFNFTMPVTLVAISNTLPGKAGFSFGLTTLALFLGAVPTYTEYKGWFQVDWVILIFILFALLFFYFGLRTLLKQKKA
ncbi:MFS transporter [uncultured Draconibacterium sp.]|uniref:MFS transporter n=1 Tax=uncultured Draconibacterium sp. TaxID=1573823 RepID=UPI0025F6C1C1|nr:MFS transporter [uncultured Draconibacterium sp.]